MLSLYFNFSLCFRNFVLCFFISIYAVVVFIPVLKGHFLVSHCQSLKFKIKLNNADFSDIQTTQMRDVFEH